jgi:hypothetical protein
MSDDTKQDIEAIMNQVQSVNSDDPDMLEKLNEIARKVAEAQGKTNSTSTSATPKAQVDPMDELGCEGCQ